MRVTVFGASGRTGRLVVAEALARGAEVTAAVRDPAKASFDERVDVAVGDARDDDAVRAAIAGADAVASTLAIAEGTEPTTAMSDATRTIVEVMEDAFAEGGSRRLVVTANSTVFSDREIADPYRIVAEEHRRDVAILRGSMLAWTVLAPKLLRDDPAAGAPEVVLDAAATGRSISRAALARLVVESVERDDWVGHLVGVADEQPS